MQQSHRYIKVKSNTKMSFYYLEINKLYLQHLLEKQNATGGEPLRNIVFPSLQKRKKTLKTTLVQLALLIFYGS